MALRFSRCVALAALVAAVLAAGCKKKKPDPAADDAPNTPAGTPGPAGGAAAGGGAQPAGGPPAGWSEARDTIGGFRLFVPGQSRVLNMTGAPADKKRLQMTMISAGTVLDAKVPMVQTHSLVPVGVKIGSSPDELYAGLLQLHQGVMTFQDVLAKESITLGGRPGLRVLTRANNYSPPPKVPDNPEFEKQMAEGYKKDIARRTTYLVTTTATRVIVILVQSEGDPNPADLKAMIDSFAFL